MSILRRASDETKRIELDDTDYLIVRSDISKREFNLIAASMPANAEKDGLSVEQATEFSAFLFESLVVGWSLDEGKPTAADYESLSAESGNAIDSALADHFSALLPSSAEGK
jgi:hypothetical protein